MHTFRFLIFVFYLTLCPCFFLKAEEYAHDLAICTIFKDNAHYFKEWIEYHRMVGVTHFYLFNNESEDKFYKVLKPYIKNKIVTLVDWPNQNRKNWGEEKFAWVRTTQATAYDHGLALAFNKAKWLAYIDCDEFLVPMKYSKMTTFLKDYENIGGVRLKWVTYGTGHVYDIPPNVLMIEALKKRAFLNHNVNTFTKCIVRPERVLKWAWIPHIYLLKNENLPAEIPIDEARINHYINRSIKFFTEKKIKDKLTMENFHWSSEELDVILNAYNDEEDHTMDRFIPDLRKKFF